MSKFKPGDLVEYCLEGHSYFHGSIFKIISAEENSGQADKKDGYFHRYHVKLIKAIKPHAYFNDKDIYERRYWDICFKPAKRKSLTFKEALAIIGE